MVRNGARALGPSPTSRAPFPGRGNPSILGTFAAAYAETGRFPPKQLRRLQRGLELAAAQTNLAELNPLRLQIELYLGRFSLPRHHPNERHALPTVKGSAFTSYPFAMELGRNQRGPLPYEPPSILVRPGMRINPCFFASLRSKRASVSNILAS